jgi:DNA-binding transcriptional MerR regulator
MLGVSPATLRRWSRRFEEYLQARDVGADGSHRRYTDHDLDTLSEIKTLLEQGWTYNQVAERLSDGSNAVEPEAYPLVDYSTDFVSARPVSAEEASQSLVRPAALAPDEGWPPAAQFLRDAIKAVTDNQQVLLNTQYANRDMLGVMIQDNLNLKEENTDLRERMLDLERELAELRRRQADFRERLETRVRVLEDAVSTLMARQQAPATPTAPPSYPAPAPPAQQSYAAPPSERRSFWSRLLGG